MYEVSLYIYACAACSKIKRKVNNLVDVFLVYRIFSSRYLQNVFIRNC